jgi:type II secretory pathway pseudopilin PulG
VIDSQQKPDQGQWRVRVAAGEFGPLDLETLRAWVQQRRVLATDLVHHPETGGWVPAGNVTQLADDFRPGAGGAAHTKAPRRGVNVTLLVGALVVIVVVAVGALLVLRPALTVAREAARRAACLNNLKQLGLAMNQYAQDFRASYPWREGVSDTREAWRDLGLIYPNYMTAMKCFKCPSSADRVLEPKATGGGMLDSGHFGTLAGESSEEAISYSYGFGQPRSAPARPWRVGDPGTIRLLADKKAGVELSSESPHGTEGRNVLGNDGHVEWIEGPEWLDPDETNERIGRPDENDFTRWWSDPPYCGE